IGKGGFLDTPNQRLQIQHTLPVLTPDDLARVPVARRHGTTLTLGDVAVVREGTLPLIGDAVINDGPGLMLVVEKFPWANTLELTRGVEDALSELRPGLPGLEMDPTIFQAADFIDLAIHNLTRALIIGSLLVLLVIGLFLFEWRTALISLIAIPLSYGLAVLASMLVALTVTPALGLILLGRAPIERRDPPLVRRLQPVYQRVLTPVLRAPLRVASVGIVIFLAGVFVVPHLGEALLPEFKEQD